MNSGWMNTAAQLSSIQLQADAGKRNTSNCSCTPLTPVLHLKAIEFAFTAVTQLCCLALIDRHSSAAVAAAQQQQHNLCLQQAAQLLPDWRK
jgi:hypothetical protein